MFPRLQRKVEICKVPAEQTHLHLQSENEHTHEAKTSGKNQKKDPLCQIKGLALVILKPHLQPHISPDASEEGSKTDFVQTRAEE